MGRTTWAWALAGLAALGVVGSLAGAGLRIPPQAVPGARPAGAPAPAADPASARIAPVAPASVFWPDDSGYTSVRACGAKGDGTTDDTAAIRAAYEKKGGIYFPPGTYLVSDTISATPKRHFIQGAGPGRTVIRLRDRAEGFADPANPKAVLQNWDEKIGRGANGQAFRNSYHDLAIDVGSGNPGAIGLLYFTNNQGTLANVHVRSSDPDKAGRAGIALAQCWPGPALLRHVRVDGFDDGIWSIINQYSFTLEHIVLENQRQAGIRNSRQMLFIRGLASRQRAAPALLAESGTIVLVDSVLAGAGEAAVVSGARLYARRVKTSGYRAAIQAAGGGPGAPGPDVEEFASGFTTLLDGPKQTLALPVEESPTADWSNPADWAGAAAFGARPDDKQDDTDALQKAIDSGARVVYLPRGTYDVRGTVRVRGSVQRIHCMESNIDSGSGDAPLWRIEDGSAPFVLIEQYEGTYASKRLSFEHASMRTLVLRTLIPRGGTFYAKTVPGPAKVFLDDVCAAPCDFGNATVYARQLNPENMGTKVVTDGGLLWILGLKTEKAGTCVLARGGARAEILGGYLYRNRGTQMPDGSTPEAFVNENASLSVCGIAGDTRTRETQAGETRTGSFGAGVYVGRHK